LKKHAPLQQKTALRFENLLALLQKHNQKSNSFFNFQSSRYVFGCLKVMQKYDNICNYIHLPVQSGSNAILKKMNRQHTREEYFQLIDSIREIIPDCGISHDMIAGFPTETEQDHQDTLDLMDYVKYDFGFMFAYSERPGTLAARKIEDDVPETVKKRRLSEIIEKQQNTVNFELRNFLEKQFVF